MRRLVRLLLLVLLLGNLGCRLLPPQTPDDGSDRPVTTFRGGRAWQTPGGFGPEFWSQAP